METIRKGSQVAYFRRRENQHHYKCCDLHCIVHRSIRSNIGHQAGEEGGQLERTRVRKSYVAIGLP